MANWDRNFSNGSYYNNWHGRLVYNLDSQNVAGNSSHISLYLQIYADGGYSQNGTWDGRIYINGGQVARATPSYSAGSGLWQITSYGADIGHDANGNLHLDIGDYINAPINEMTQASIGWDLPRIPLAPGILGETVDSITPTSARLGAEITNDGHGTSATLEMFYRLQGSGSYISLGSQADASGYNYWNVTGLQPGKTYEYLFNVTNNNGDTAQSGAQTFKTQSIAGLTPLLMALL
jgi:hypothetical protein